MDTGWSCSNGGTVSGPLTRNLILPLVAVSTPLVKASASVETAGLVRSQLESRRTSAACAENVKASDVAKTKPI
ncbi:hypothetical protein D3C83_207350 [compost metagenome]